MFKQNKSPQSINFLETVYAPTDIWSRAYIWLVEVGKYLLIAVEFAIAICEGLKHIQKNLQESRATQKQEMKLQQW